MEGQRRHPIERAILLDLIEQWGINLATGDNKRLQRLWRAITLEYAQRSGTEVEQKKLWKWYSDFKYRTKKNQRMEEEGWKVDKLVKTAACLALAVAVFWRWRWSPKMKATMILPLGENGPPPCCPQLKC